MRSWTGSSFAGVPGMVLSNFCTAVVVRDGNPAFQRMDMTNQVVKDTLVQRSLVSSALPELLVVVVQA